MRDNIEIRRVGSEQYVELMDVLDESFGFKFQSEGIVPFIRLLPKLYKEQYRPWDNNICVVEDGRIKAAVGLYYSAMRVCGETLRVGGIGNVAVLPDERRKGYMKAAMCASVDEMKGNGTDFCFLDGQRQRYRYFGFDCAGYVRFFFIHSSNIYHTYGEDCAVPLSVEPITAENIDADFILSLYNRNPVRTERDPAALYDILCSWDNTPFYLCRDGRRVGYFVSGDAGLADGYVNEFAVADESDIPDAIRTLTLSMKKKELELDVPVWDEALIGHLSEISAMQRLREAQKISIYNYRNTLNAFLKYKALETPLPDCSATVLIHGERCDERLLLSVKNGVCCVEETDAPLQIELTHTEATAFFFGMNCVRRREAGAFAACLPLPIPVMGQDHV